MPAPPSRTLPIVDCSLTLRLPPHCNCSDMRVSVSDRVQIKASVQAWKSDPAKARALGTIVLMILIVTIVIPQETVKSVHLLLTNAASGHPHAGY